MNTIWNFFNPFNREKIEEKLRCHFPWISNGNFKNCTELSEVMEFEKTFDYVNRKSPTDNGKEYGCKIPCEYNEIVLVEERPIKAIHRYRKVYKKDLITLRSCFLIFFFFNPIDISENSQSQYFPKKVG